MSRSSETRKRASRKQGKVATQASAQRIIKPKAALVADPVPQTLSSISVSEERIRECAYLKGEAAGRPEGDGADFWFQAERELLEAE